MPINPNTGDASAGLYAVTVWQRYKNSDVKWVNRYQVYSYETVTGAAFGVFCDALANFHADLLNDFCEVEKVTISTAEEDSNPYNGDELATYSFRYGGRLTLQQHLPLTAVVMVNKVTLAGRWGKVYLRGCVFEQDVDSVLGKWVVNPTSNLVSRVEQAAANRLNPFLNTNPTGIKFVLLSNNQLRNVVGFAFGKVGTMKLDRKYYDKQ